MLKSSMDPNKAADPMARRAKMMGQPGAAPTADDGTPVSEVLVWGAAQRSQLTKKLNPLAQQADRAAHERQQAALDLRLAEKAAADACVGLIWAGAILAE